MRKQRSSLTPIYQRIKHAIKERIERGDLSPGDRVPSENELARTLGVSRSQTRLALRDLEMEGYLRRSQGKPTVVADPAGWGAQEAADSRGARPTRKVVVACPARPRSFYTEELVTAFVNHVSNHGIETMFYYLNLNPDAELRFLSRVESDGVSGLALWPVFRTRDVCDLVAKFYEDRFPCVLFDRYLPGLHTDFVGTDNRDAYTQLTSDLVRRGHRSIAYLARDFHDTVQDDRFMAFRRVLEAAEVALPSELPVEVGYAGQNPYAEAVVEGILSAEPRPTAIVCSDGLVARHLLGLLDAWGVSAPDEVEVASMDDEDPATWFAYPMSRVVQDGAQVGRQTAELLLSRIALPNRPVEQRFVRASFPVAEGARPGARTSRNRGSVRRSVP